MKINIIRKDERQDGSSLLLALFIMLALSFTLATYLHLAANERTLTTRSQDWNAAIPVAEAGVEEAMTQLYYFGTNGLATNNWTLQADGMYHKIRTFSTSNYFGTAIQPAAHPVIWSTGCVMLPSAGTNIYIRRLIKVVAYKQSGYGYGILAKGTISISGGASVDSFDSTDPSHSTNGLYCQSLSTSNVVVLSDTNVAGAINLSGGYIHGSADTAAGGTVTTSGSAYVDSTRNDANVQINDPLLPAVFTNGSGSYSSVLPTNVRVNGTNYPYGVTTGNYELGNLNIGSNPMVVNGNAVIYCTQTGNNVVNISGSGFIYMTPGSTLAIYSAGNIVISGNGVVNGSQIAADCSIYGLSTCATAVYSGSSAFIGVVDVPEADFTFSGGTAASGAFTASTVTISGSAGLHYDTSLGSSGQGYAVQSWNEVPLQ